MDKRHAVLTFDGYEDKFRVKDLGSVNGVSSRTDAHVVIARLYQCQSQCTVLWELLLLMIAPRLQH